MSKIQATVRSTRLIDKQISPPVRCFCCQDSGLVSNIYITEFVEIPENGDILPFICQRDNCEKGQAYLRSYSMSDEERNVWHNNQLRGKDGENIPKPMRSFEYRANFSTNLNQGCCDWLHDRSYQDWVDSVRNPRKSTVIAEFNAVVDERSQVIQDIQSIADSLGGLKESFDTALKYFCDRDKKQYGDWTYLPIADLKTLRQKVKKKLGEANVF